MKRKRIDSFDPSEITVTQDVLKRVDPAMRNQVFNQLQELRDIKEALNKTIVVAITDADGTITYVNDKFCELYKYSREEILGKNHRMFKSGEHPREFYENLWQTISNGKIFTGEIKNRAKDGGSYWAATAIVPFMDEAGQISRYVSFRTDITPIKKAQEERVRHLETLTALSVAEMAVKTRDDFVSMTAHELKTPITSIQLLLQMLMRFKDQDTLSKDQESRFRRMLGSAYFQTKRLVYIINDLLDVSRIAAGHLELALDKVSLSALIRDVVAHSQEDLVAAHVSVKSDVADGIEGHWDKAKLEQVVINLLSNAIKYGKGRPIAIAAWRDGRVARILVKDQGIGIPKEFQKKLFQRFERADAARDFKGLGLGLWISEQIVVAHQGKIWVESEVDKGSTFIVELPL